MPIRLSVHPIVKARRSKPHEKVTQGVQSVARSIQREKGISYTERSRTPTSQPCRFLNLAPASHGTPTARHYAACRAVAEIPVVPRAGSVPAAAAPLRALRCAAAASARALLCLVPSDKRVAALVLCCRALSSARDERVLKTDLLGSALGLC